jgi:hypothetical protein
MHAAQTHHTGMASAASCRRSLKCTGYNSGAELCMLSSSVTTCASKLVICIRAKHCVCIPSSHVEDRRPQPPLQNSWDTRVGVQSSSKKAMAEDAQVLVRFVTKLPEQYRVPATQVVRLPVLSPSCAATAASDPPVNPAGSTSKSQAVWAIPNHQPSAGTG